MTNRPEHAENASRRAAVRTAWVVGAVAATVYALFMLSTALGQ